MADKAAKAVNKTSPVKKTTTKTKKAGKKEKDPNAPKRAMSAFFFWMGENRDRIKKRGMGVSDVAKQAGIEWSKLTDKSTWEKMAAYDQKRYDAEKAIYDAAMAKKK